MNRLGLNTLVILLLTGCSGFNKNFRTDAKGETINKNAPVFISPKTNAIPVNKPNVNEVAPNKPARVTFNAENYVMVKEKDLNILVDQKTNENLLNIKKSNANAPQPNKELDAAIDAHIQRKKSGDSSDSLTTNVLQLAPVAQEKASTNPPAIHPFFAFVLIVLLMVGSILTVGYFFFVKKKASNEPAAPTAATSSEVSKMATENTTKDTIDKDTEAKKD